MSAEEHTETLPVTSDFDALDRAREHDRDEAAPLLPGPMAHWLEARTAGVAGDVAVFASASAARWSLRVEHGNSASSIELPVRGEHGSSDVANSLRRWARGRGLVARSEQSRAHEWRVVLSAAGRS